MNRQAVAPATVLYATPAGLERPLRVVLVAPRQVPGWVRAFHDLAACNEWIELVVVTAFEAPLPIVSDVSVDLRAIIAWEHCVHRQADANLLPQTIASDHELSADADAPAALQAQLSALCPDLVLLLGPQAWASALAPQAPWGCWHLDASLTDSRYAGLSLLAPMVRGETATHVELVVHGHARPPIVLAGSRGRTRATSFLKQRHDAFRKLPPLLLRALLRVAARRRPTLAGSWGTLQLQPQPTLGRATGLRLLMSTVRATGRSMVKRFRDRGWTLVVRNSGVPLDPGAPVIGSHTLLKAPKGWWADPCVVAAEGRTLLFVEEMDLTTNKATIACLELINGGACRLGTALKEPGHLSFPQAFCWEGQWYLTVESGYDRRTSLYRANDFPLGWVRVRDLVTGRACVDPLLHRHEGHWYLFVNVAESQNSSCDDLFLFVADSLEGPFRPHPANPIVCDVRRARMAGRLFRHQGRLIRPSQDCGPSYGCAVVFNEVLELSPDVYRERAISRLAPHAGTLDGCHTYTADGGIEVLDILGRPPSDATYLKLFDDSRSAATAEAPRMYLPRPLRRAFVSQPAPEASSARAAQFGAASVAPTELAERDE